MHIIEIDWRPLVHWYIALNSLLEELRYDKVYKYNDVYYVPVEEYVKVHGLDKTFKAYKKQHNRVFKRTLFGRIFHPQSYTWDNTRSEVDFDYISFNYKLRDNCWLFWNVRTTGSKYEKKFFSFELLKNWLVYQLTGKIAEGNGVTLGGGKRYSIG